MENNNNNHNSLTTLSKVRQVVSGVTKKVKRVEQVDGEEEDEQEEAEDENRNRVVGCLGANKCCTFSVLAEMRRKSKAEAAKILERDENIRAGGNDPADYRYVVLANGVRALLASDRRVNCSAAAVDIRVGAFSDPVRLQGLAHLLEHVLFTGSEAFPGESFGRFLSERGGSSNAYTASEHTNFHFDVPSAHFESALERFVAFFERPLFRESNVRAELEIVQSEHEKNRYNEIWRTNQVRTFHTRNALL